MNNLADTYMEEGFDRVDGWPGQTSSVKFMAIFKELFDSNNESGGVCEIGVHHAKYLIALHNFLRPRASLGIDLFHDQDKNFSESGRGVRSICEANIRNYAYNPPSVNLMTKDSLDLRPEDLAGCGKIPCSIGSLLQRYQDLTVQG